MSLSLLRHYTSRAHPTAPASVPIQLALETLLSELQLRHHHRAHRWNTDTDRRLARRIAYLTTKGKEDPPLPTATPYKPMDEAFSLALQLNLDPRKPGQALRGSLALPHGTGKTFPVAVFTEDTVLAQEALDRGAILAGGQRLVDSILSGQVAVTSFQRTIATPDMMPQLARVARILGPRGLMPNPKLGTIQSKENIVPTLEKQQSGISNYRTDKEGIVRVGLGRGSMGLDKLMDNVREFMTTIQGVKPDQFGKGKKKTGGAGGVSKGTKYYLKAHLSATQSNKSVLVDVRTIDPTSAFFMGIPQ